MAIPILNDLSLSGDLTLAATRSLYFADEKIKIGDSTSTPGTQGIQLGEAATASGAQAIAFGYDGNATGAQSIAIGYNPTASGTYSIALGYNIDATGTGTVAIGTGDSFSEASTLCTNLDMLARTNDGAVLHLQTSDTTVVDGGVLGSIQFSAPEEGSGTDAILVGAEIVAVAEGTFAADNNATELLFKVGASGAASTALTIGSDKKATFADDIYLNSATPSIYFTDTDTGGDSVITGDSAAASLLVSADYNNEVNTTKIYFRCDGDQVGHFRGNNAYVGSFRLFPEKNNETEQGIFFGTQTAGSYSEGSAFSDTRVMSMDSSSVLHLYPGTGTTGAIQIASSGTGTVTFGGRVVLGGDTLQAGGDVDVTGAIKCTQNFKRTVTTATNASNTHTCTLTDNDNFNIAVANAATTIALVVASENVGQSGMIVLTNPASVGSLSFVALPSYMLTPSGATLNFVTTANAVSIISYYVHATDKVLVNYVGNFA